MIREIPNKKMRIASSARIAENAALVGEVEIAAEASIWYGAVLRGDAGAIRIGRRCTVEDNVTVHGQVTLGDNTVVGHNAVIHGCQVGKNCLIGMGAIVMNGAIIGEGSMVAAGCLVTQRTVVPPHSLIQGVPGVVVGPLTKKQEAYVQGSADAYCKFAEMQLPCWSEDK